MYGFRKYFSDYLSQNEITQVEASQRIGISQQAVSGLLNSDTRVRPSTKRKVYAAFPEFEDYVKAKGLGILEDAIPMSRDLSALDNFHPLEIVDYLDRNRQRFMGYSLFQKLILTFSMDQSILDLKKELARMELDRIQAKDNRENISNGLSD